MGTKVNLNRHIVEILMDQLVRLGEERVMAESYLSELQTCGKSEEYTEQIEGRKERIATLNSRIAETKAEILSRVSV